MNTYRTAFGRQIPLAQLTLDVLAAVHRVLALSEVYSEDPLEFAARARQTLRRDFPRPEQYHAAMRGPVGAVYRDCFYRASAAKRPELRHELLLGLGCNPLRLLYDRFLDGDWRYQSDFAADANLGTAAVSRAFKAVMENEGRGEVSTKNLEGALAALGVSTELENGGDEGRGDSFAVVPSSPTCREWVLLLLTSALTRCLSQVRDLKQDTAALKACRDTLALNLAFLFDVRDFHGLTDFTDLVLRQMLGVADAAVAGGPGRDGTPPAALLAMLVNPDAQSFRLFVPQEAELPDIRQLLALSRGQAAHIPPAHRRDDAAAEPPVLAGSDWTEKEKTALAELGNSPWAHSIENAWSEAVLRVDRWARSPLASQRLDQLVKDLEVHARRMTTPSAPADLGGLLALQVVALNEADKDENVLRRYDALGLALVPEERLRLTPIQFGIWDCDLLGWAKDGGLAARHRIELESPIECKNAWQAQRALCYQNSRPEEPNFRALMFARQLFDDEFLTHSSKFRELAVSNVFRGNYLFCNKDLTRRPLDYQQDVKQEEELRRSWNDYPFAVDHSFDKAMPEFFILKPIDSLTDIVLYLFKHKLIVYAHNDLGVHYWNTVLAFVGDQLAPLGYTSELRKSLGARLWESTPWMLADKVQSDPRALFISTGPLYAAALACNLHRCLGPEDVWSAIMEAEKGPMIQESIRDAHRKSFVSTHINTSLYVSFTGAANQEKEFWGSSNNEFALDRLCTMIMTAAKRLSARAAYTDYADFIKYVHARELDKYPNLDLAHVGKAFDVCYSYHNPEVYAREYYSPFGNFPIDSNILLRNENVQAANEVSSDHTSSETYYGRFQEQKKLLAQYIEFVRSVLESLRGNSESMGNVRNRDGLIKDLGGVLEIAEHLHHEEAHVYGSRILMKVILRVWSLNKRRSGESRASVECPANGER